MAKGDLIALEIVFFGGLATLLALQYLTTHGTQRWGSWLLATLVAGALALIATENLLAEPQTASPTPSNAATSPEPQTPAAVAWTGLEGKNGGEERWPYSFVDEPIDASQTLMVSSGSMNVPGIGACPGGTTSVCVMVFPGDSNSRGRVDGLTPLSTWWGWSQASAGASILDKVLNQRLGWFSSSNCVASNGCNVAWIYLVDNQITVDLALNPPATATKCEPYFQHAIGTDVGPTFKVFRGITGFIDLEYWVRDQPHRARLPFSKEITGYELQSATRYGSVWAYPDRCAPSEPAPGFVPWAEGDGLNRITTP